MANAGPCVVQCVSHSRNLWILRLKNGGFCSMDREIDWRPSAGFSVGGRGISAKPLKPLIVSVLVNKSTKEHLVRSLRVRALLRLFVRWTWSLYVKC